MSNGSEAEAAIERALAFLESSQRADGEIPVQATIGPIASTTGVDDPSIFPTALAAWSLSFHPKAAPIRDRALDFLTGQMDLYGLWRHWTRDHPQFASLPPDLDDTSCACAALIRSGRAIPDNRDILLANRDGSGMFLTWFIPRSRWTGRAHANAVAAQLFHLPTLYFFFRRTSAAPSDVDAVANANALFLLGRSEATEPVIEHLRQILREGREAQCDKWYESPFAIWYFLSRALGPGEIEVAEIVEHRIARSSPRSALEAALALCSLINFGKSPPASLADLLIVDQLPSGAWTRDLLYHGGRAKQPDGSFAAPHPDTPYWGSQALTTAFCIEALCRMELVA